MNIMSKPHISAMSSALKRLALPGVQLQKQRQAGRLIVVKGSTKVDLWPTSENWRVRRHGLSMPQYPTNKGLDKLIKFLSEVA